MKKLSKISTMAAIALALTLMPMHSSAATIADYVDDFATPSPATGWDYLWNSGGAIGTATNYQSLNFNTVGNSPADGTPQYTNVGGVAFNDAGQGEFQFGRATTGDSHTGAGTSNGAAQDRFVIAAYTIQPADAGFASIANSSFAKVNTSGNGVDLRVYVNDTLQGSFSKNAFNSTTSSPFDGALGTLSAGDTVYVAVGPNGDRGADATRFDFSLVSPGTLLWTGGGDGVSVYQEANWTLDGGATPAGTIDPNVNVNQNIVATSGTPGGPGGGGAHLELGPGGSLTVGGTAVFRMSQGSSAGIFGDAGDPRPIDVGGTSELLAQFITSSGVTLGDSGELTLYGGGNPINNATIDFTSSLAILNLLDETTADFISEHLSKITVNGAPAVVGVNLSVVSDGGSGSIVTAIIATPTAPEPSTLLLAVMGLFGLVATRRRRIRS